MSMAGSQHSADLSQNYVGKDLEGERRYGSTSRTHCLVSDARSCRSGNRFYELPPANGGRTKRVVEYRVQRDIADYTSGTQTASR